MRNFYSLLLVFLGCSLWASGNKLTCPTATAIVSNSTICSGETTAISLTSDVANTTFTWVVITNGLVGASSGSGNTIAQTLSTIGTSQGSVTYIITPSVTGCTGNSITVTLMVNPRPEIFAPSAPQSICNGWSTNTSLQSFNFGITYYWNVVMSNVTGGSIGTNTTGVINQTLTLTGQGPGQAVYTVTPFLGNCSGNPVTIIFNVYPQPTVTVNSSTICSGSSATVTATPGASGTYTYAWTVPPGVPNPGNVASFTTTTAGTYSVVASNNGCASASASGVVTVNPAAGSFNLQCGPSNSLGHLGQIYIDWSNVVGITNFNYSYSINGGPVITGSQSAPSSMYINNNNLPVTFTLSGTGTVCVAPETITCGTLNTNENNIDDFVISPNPVTDILNIKNNQTINKVTAFNQLGQIVLQKEYNNNEVQLDFSALKTGIYFISVDSDNKQSTFKIVKNQ